MLRAVRLAAKLEFEIAPEALEPFQALGGLLRDVPPARLYDETLKLFQAGHAVRSLELLLQHDLLRYLFPHTAEALEADQTGKVLAFLRAGLANTDRRVAEDQPVTPMFLYAIFLWHPICALADQLQVEEGSGAVEALLDACDEIVRAQQSHTSYPRRFSTPMKDMLVMQQRFTNRRGARAHRLLQNKRFRAAYDFLVLRARCGEEDPELAEWWTDVQELSPNEQRQAFSVKRHRRPRQRRSSGRSASSGPDSPTVR